MTSTTADPLAGRGRWLRWALVVNQIAAAASTVLVALFFLVVVRSGWLLSLTIPIGALAVLLGVAVRRVDRGDMSGAIRIHAAAGKQIMERKAKLLMQCPDSRLLSYRRIDEDKRWELFGARHEVSIAKIERKR